MADITEAVAYQALSLAIIVARSGKEQRQLSERYNELLRQGASYSTVTKEFLMTAHDIITNVKPQPE